MRYGYSENFIANDTIVPLPKVSPECQDDVLFKDELREGFIVDYVHYSVVMNKQTKQAFFSAANIDQKRYKSVSDRKWFTDSRVGHKNQIPPIAYKHNPWDRGHLTRRAIIAWGSKYEAKKASLDSCSYANACFQHENFNQDEWKKPEEIAYDFSEDSNNRLCVFTGPIFSELDRYYTLRGIEPVRIPSAFWKLILYKGKTSRKLETRGFIMYQDEEFLRDKMGRYNIDIKNYQVTTTEIESLTGLEFGQDVFDTNPLFYYENEYTRDNKIVVPETIPLKDISTVINKR